MRIQNIIDKCINYASSIVNLALGTSMASATAMNLANATGNTLTVSGTASIETLGTVQAGAKYLLRFTGTCTLVNSASLVLPGGGNISVAVGDFAEFLSLGENVWECVMYTKASGEAVADVSNLVTKADYADDNSILVAATAENPASVVVAPSTIVGRKASGDATALTASEVNTILGTVLKADFDANTILAATTDDTPAAVTIAEQRIVGRKTGGNISALTLTEILDMVGSAADGDILIRSGGAWTRLAKGTDGDVLTLVSGLPAWVTP